MVETDLEGEAWLGRERRRRRALQLCAAGGALALIASAVAFVLWKDGAPARESAADADTFERACRMMTRCGRPCVDDDVMGPPSGRHFRASVTARVVEECGGVSCEQLAACTMDALEHATGTRPRDVTVSAELKSQVFAVVCGSGAGSSGRERELRALIGHLDPATEAELVKQALASCGK